jgi:hypothetical protein
MVDAAFSHQRRLEDLSISGGRQRRIFAIVVGLTLVGLGCVLVQRGWKPDSHTSRQGLDHQALSAPCERLWAMAIR